MQCILYFLRRLQAKCYEPETNCDHSNNQVKFLQLQNFFTLTNASSNNCNILKLPPRTNKNKILTPIIFFSTSEFFLAQIIENNSFTIIHTLLLLINQTTTMTKMMMTMTTIIMMFTLSMLLIMTMTMMNNTLLFHWNLTVDIFSNTTKSSGGSACFTG